MLTRQRRMPARGIRLAAIGLAALVIAAYWVFGRGEQAADWRDWPRESELGLSFAMPPGRVARVFDTHMELDNPASLRAADYIALYPDGPPSAVRVGDGPILREGGRPAPFTIRQNEGGSAGAAYTLHTTKDLEDRRVVLLAVIQSEGLFTPNFAEAWAVWESLRLAD